MRGRFLKLAAVRLSEEWRRRAPNADGDFVTIAEMLIRQGRQEGHQEGRLDTLEQLVRSGMEWRDIKAAADPATLRALKERLAAERTNGHPDGGDHSDPPR